MKKIIIISISVMIIIVALIFYKPIKECIINSFIKSEFNKNSITLDFNENKDNMVNLLKDDIEKNDIFLVGEYHATSTAIKLKIDFLKFFVENANVKYILFEVGYTTAQILNEFLISGDNKILDFIMSSSYGTFVYTQEHYNFFLDLYEFNKSLPKNKKLMIVGIDIEHQPNIALNYIKSILPKTQPPKDISEYFKILEETNINNFLIKSNEIAKGIKDNEKSFKLYLGEKFFDFKFSINNLSVSIPGLGDREQYIKSNFTTLYERLPKAKYFGQFGAMHVIQKGEMSKSNPTSLANFLNNEYEKTKDKVMSIFPALNNSYFLDPNYGVQGPINSLSKLFFPKDKLIKLVKLNYKDSPFLKYRLLVEEAPTTEYYEYLLLISDSPECTMYHRNN